MSSAKPSDEEIARLRLLKQEQRAKEPAKRKKLQEPKAPDVEAEAMALKAWGLERPLIDVCANIHGRGTFDEVKRKIDRATLAHVDLTILTGCDLESSMKGKLYCEQWAAVEKTQKVLFTAGIHPHEASSWSRETERKVRELTTSPYFVALGECGLDYDRMLAPRELQQEVFRKQVSLAKELDVPLFVHCRERDEGPPLGAYSDLLDVLKDLEPTNVCIHCFTGNSAELEEIINFNCFLGLTGFVGIAKRAGKTIEALREAHLLDKILLETDSPFMSPDKSWLPKETTKKLGVRGGQNEPALLPAVARALAAALTTQDNLLRPDDLAAASTKNALAFFRLPRPHLFQLAEDFNRD